MKVDMKIYWMTYPEKTNIVNDGDFFSFFQRNKTRDEIDGYIVDKWIEFLKDKGLCFCTLNPIIPNFLDDDFAKENIYVKVSNGDFKKLGDIETVKFKFDILGPGEVLCDTDWSIL